MLLGGGLLAVSSLFFARDFYLEGVHPATLSTWDAVSGPGFMIAGLAALATSLYGLAASLHAVRRASTESGRRRARWFALAFGVRDVLFCVLIIAYVVFGVQWVGAVAPQIATLLYVPLLVYGILKSQLFDIDLKIKWTLRRGTVAAIFLAVFFAASEGAAAFFESRTGSTLAGIGAAALLVFIIAPLQRAADRLADAAMPRVQATPTYVAFRRMEVYRAALEGAMQDGEVTEREREMLRRLRASLSVPEEDAQALERDLVGHPGAAG